jgi:hypothetical protein
MRFLRIGDETIRLDLVTHIKEGCREETHYGRSVRKTSDLRYGWVEVHFVSGEVIKIEGEGAEILRRVLDEVTDVRELTTATPAPKAVAREDRAHEPTGVRHDHASRALEEHRSGMRNGFGR